MKNRMKMNCRRILITFLVLLQIPLFSNAQLDLEHLFKNPPDLAKPRGYWVWAHGNFDYETIKAELKAFKEMGLGGVDIFDMGIADPLDVIPPGNPFMSDEMMDGIAFALKEAKKLNLSMGLSVSNGWNAGGDWTTPDEKLMRLLFWSDTVTGPIHIDQIGFPEVPTTFKKPYGTFELFPQFTEDGFPEYYENVALIAYPVTPDQHIRDFNQVIYYDVNNIDGNQVTIDLPEGNWILSRAVVTPLGQKMWMRSERSNGFIMDHYSRKATKHHFEYIIDRLEERMGDLGESALERLYLASFEAENYVIWSPELSDEFYTRNSYRIDPYFPIFSGQTIISKEVTERFLHDYRTTVSEMFVNNHYRQASGICREHGILLASESGGPGPPLHYVPTEDAKALGAVDIMRGEFWNSPKRWDDRIGNDLLQVVKNIGSAAHIYGHEIVEMESFTSHNKHWQETPWDLKKLADRAFCEGMTRVVYHTMPHSPPEAGVPGWSYQAGTHIHPKMTWWPMSKTFHEYLARCSAMLMEGRFVADVAYYKGGEVPNFSTAKYIHPDLGFGYDYDDLNSEILLQIKEVKNGKIVIPSGMEYEVLVLPEDNRMDLAVLRKIEELINKGATVIGPRPTGTYGLKGYPENDTEVNNIADNIWGKSKSKKKINKKYGEGRIIYGETTRNILLEKGILTDVKIKTGKANIDYIHRTSKQGEIYFIRNVDSVACDLELQFRVHGLHPEFWDPTSASINSVNVYHQNNAGTLIPLHLQSFESIFIVFRKSEVHQNHAISVSLNSQKVYPSLPSNPDGFHIIYSPKEDMQIISDQSGTYVIEFSNGIEKSVEVNTEKKVRELAGQWDVRFPHGWEVEPLQHFDQLRDWTTSVDPGLKYFSGIATYRKSFSMSKNELTSEYCWTLNLGIVGEVAAVYLNGKEIGNSLFPPHVLDITNYLKSGQNNLVVEVANTWRNRLIGDSKLPLERQLTSSNLANGNDPNNRPWSNLNLFPSGLIGPVNLIRKIKTNITQ